MRAERAEKGSEDDFQEIENFHPLLRAFCERKILHILISFSHFLTEITFQYSLGLYHEQITPERIISYIILYHIPAELNFNNRSIK